MSTTGRPSFLTYPSISSTFFDVPEPVDITAKFHYNYFLPDEMVSTNTMPTPENFKKHRDKYARTVELQFTPLNAVVPDQAALSELQLSDREKQKLLLSNLDKITKETEFMSPGYVGVKLQDSTISKRLIAGIEATMLQKNIDTYSLSPTETMLRYASETSDNVDGQAILDSVDIDDNNEYVSIDLTTGEPFEVQKTGEVDKLTFNVSLSERFAADIAKNAISTPVSPAASILEGSVPQFVDVQTQARSDVGSGPRVVKSSDFIRTFNPIQKERIGLDDVFLGGNTVMGYHIRKYADGEANNVEDIYITNTSATTYSDIKIRYGSTYNYSIAVVYLIRIFSFEGKQAVSADLLVESRESPSINVRCREVVPPSAPDGLSFYLLPSKQLVVEWDFPVNPTDDVKRFQVFRRKTIHDPFELVCELDFDDSVLPPTRYEEIAGYERKKLKNPSTSTIDYTFDINSKYIYAVCAVDAHDLSSGYSEQFRVSFDKFSAKLVVEFISEKNAPKPYPNFMLRSQLTEDVMKDSNHSSLTCYFDPEYLKVFNGNREELDFLQVSESEVSYKIQLIHLNFQQSVVADINVK